MNKKDFLSATTIAQCSYCENRLALDTRYGKKTSELEQKRQARGDEEHLRHDLAARKYGNSDRRCFVATEVYGAFAQETDDLRNFRDTVLKQSWYGRLFITAYYDISPALVVAIRKAPFLRGHVRRMLDQIVRWVSND